MEKYSVLMTVYTKDNPDYFALALDSMVNQTYKPDEIVIVKDGPITDELQRVIDDCTEKYDHIVQVQLRKNKGLGLALNAGLKVVKNDLIARMDSDDYSMPDRCSLQAKEFEKHPSLDIVGCPVQEFVGTIDNIVGERKVPLTNKEIYRFARKRDPFNHPTVMYRKKAVLKAGGYSDYRKNQDTDLWIKMLLNKAKCKNLPEPVFRFRFDENTYKKRKSWTNTKILIEIRYKAFKAGFNSFWEFLMIAAAQLGMFILPTGFQKFVYKTILRR
ncbi:MAG: glycosyltransferase [Lachnospiraceae bacterium]|nr:glycosyltransferase [Lachnospiraceae bacterium]